jgi:predicted DNA-binding transcriptional regulator YafY
MLAEKWEYINMKLNRLLEITTILLNRKTITASELAERFEVSVRTIYRDVEVLSASGVPVYSLQGKNGGISLIEDYTVSRAAFTDSEKDSILVALQTLQSTKYPQAASVLEKLGGIFNKEGGDWISVDFSPWGANPNAYNKFNDIRYAILSCKIIKIDYINAQNIRTAREIEPLRLIFKSQAWYLYGWCLSKKDFRLFRLSRIKKTELTDKSFERNRLRIPPQKPPVNEPENQLIHLVLQFSEEALYRLCDDYDDDYIIHNPDGSYTIALDIPEDEWVYGYIMSFGASVRVLEPEHIKQIIRCRCEAVLSYYRN